MAESSWPFDPQDTTETQYSYIFRNLVTTGVIGDESTTFLRPYADSSGMNVKVPAGLAFVRGHMYVNDAVKTLAVDAANTSPRIDVVVLRLDPTANEIVAAIVKGTPASSPSAPSLTQTDAAIWETPLAYITVGASVSTISAGSVSDRRIFCSSPYDKWTTDQRPVSPRRGDAGFNLTINAPEYWSGSSWTRFSPTSFTASQISDQNNINAGRIGGRRITVSNSGAPSGPSVGDVFIDWS